MRKLVIVFLVMITNGIIICLMSAKDNISERVQMHVGNFALPTSQQPAPLIAFGQNDVDKGDLLFIVSPNQLKGKEKKFVEIVPSILYGITDKLWVFIEIPVAITLKSKSYSSHGLEDLRIQFEGVMYRKQTVSTKNEITLVGNINAPTGSAFKQPATGFGAPSFFLGFTARHKAIDWYYYTSWGLTLPTSHKNTKFGKQFLYQFGLSRNIFYKADEWILNWLIELDGTYIQHDKILGQINANSGGNMIILGPSLWFSTRHFFARFGISGVISEHLFGMQPKDSYYMKAKIGCKF